MREIEGSKNNKPEFDTFSDLQELLTAYKSGDLNEEEILYQLSRHKYLELGYAKIDHHREIRTGLPEVIYAAHKNIEHLIGIADAWEQDKGLIFSRLHPDDAKTLKKKFPHFRYDTVSKLGVLGNNAPQRFGRISIVTAGTSDFPVAQEAKYMLEALGYQPDCFYDCGVAGLHRLLAHLTPLKESHVIIAIAGMEGALPSVLAGLVKAPLIAVPTSVGYGTHQNGQVPLMAMLNACSPGISVVNIDSGFNAATMAHAIMDQVNMAIAQQKEKT